MGSKEFEQNTNALVRLCREMGLSDHVKDLQSMVRDEQHCRDTLADYGGAFRNESRVFVTREWVRTQMKRLNRGSDPHSGLFDNLN